jgi:exodeoxyribonuclease VII small subunit
MSYAEATAELEEILRHLQSVPEDIDQLHGRVARAEQLISACREKLRGVENALEQLQHAVDE